MKAQTINIHTETGLIDKPVPLTALVGTAFSLRCTFLTNGRPGAIASLTSDTLRISVKAEGALDAEESLISLGAWSTPGSGAATVYVFEATFDSASLRTAMGSDLKKQLYAQIAWSITGEDDERRSHPIEIMAIASITESGDAAPDASDSAAWAWLKNSLPAGSRITRTVNEGAKTITFSGKAPTLSRKTTDTNCFSAAYTDLFTLGVEANKVYRLDVSLAFSVADLSKMRVRGYGPAGSSYSGFWHGLKNEGGYLLPHEGYAFADESFLIDAIAAGESIDYQPPVQSFIIVTSSTAGNVIVQAKGTAAASGVNKAGSWAMLTEIG